MHEPLTAENFWNHEYTRSLQPKGKLLLVYVFVKEKGDEPVILEDAALDTGMNISEIEGYLQQFKKFVNIEKESVAA